MQKGAMVIGERKLAKAVEDAEAAYKKDPTDENKKKLEAAKKNHETYLTCAFDEDGNLREPNEMTKELIKATGCKDENELNERLGISKISADDYEKEMNSTVKDLTNEDGTVDASKLEKAQNDIRSRAKKAHSDKAERERQEAAEAERKKKEADTKSERDANRAKDKQNEKPADTSDKNTDQAKKNRTRDVKDKLDAANNEIKKIESKLKDASGEEKDKLEKELAKKKSLVSNLEKAVAKLDDKSEKEYVVKHDGKETTIVKRPKKVGDGSTWCYKNDPDQTISPDQARAMLKASGVKEGLSITEWLELFI